MGTGVVKEVATNQEGIYLVGDLHPGVYKITISNRAFAPFVQEGVNIEPNRTRRIDVSLSIQQIATSVVVDSLAEALQTDRSDININVTSRQITNLPVTGSMGRNFQSLMTIVPGAILGGEQNSDAGNPQAGDFGET